IYFAFALCVLRIAQRAPWIPAFAGMTAERTVKPYGRLIHPIVARVDDAAFDLDRKRRRRLIGRRRQRLAGHDVEACAVARAFDLTAFDNAAGQLAAVVRADVLDRVEVAVDVEDGDRRVAVVDDAVFARQEIGRRRDADPVTHAPLRSWAS